LATSQNTGVEICIMSLLGGEIIFILKIDKKSHGMTRGHTSTDKKAARTGADNRKCQIN
jgi:hypothetical protein